MTRQLREATAWGEGPRFPIRDNDDKFGTRFDDVAAGTGIKILRTPVRAPNANAFCERAECLDHVLILSEGHLRSMLREYSAYVNDARPHQGIGQQVPSRPLASPNAAGVVVEIPVLGGLHHEYRRAA